MQDRAADWEILVNEHVVNPPQASPPKRGKTLGTTFPIVVFLAPALIFLVVFLLYPLISSFELSLLD